MKKSISVVILFVLVVFGLWGATTYWFSVKTEERYRSILQEASQTQYVKFVNESYNRGFLRSTARTILQIQTPSGTTPDDGPLRITLAHDITHGPFPFGGASSGEGRLKPLMAIIETRIVFGPEAKSYLAELYSQIPELASVRDTTVIDLGGNGEDRFSVPAFQHSFGDEDKVAVDWKGLSLQVNFTSDLKGFTGSLSCPGLGIAGKELDFSMAEVKSAFNSHEGIHGLSLGEASFDLAGLEFKDKSETGPHSFLARGFKVSASNKASGDSIQCLLTVSNDQVKYDEAQYGPAVFELELRNLDAASLAKLQQAIREMQAQDPQQSAEAMQIMMLAKYGEILPALLMKSPEIEIKQLDLKTSDGDFTGRAKVAFDGTKSGPALNPATLMNAVTVQAQFKAAEGLVHRLASTFMQKKTSGEDAEDSGAAPGDEETAGDKEASGEREDPGTQTPESSPTMVDEQLKALIEQNIIVKENGSYAATLNYKDGEIVLNGRPLSLQNLMQ